MDLFMKSQNEIDREKRLKTALGLANRAMRPGSPAEGAVCEDLLKKHMKKYGISDGDLVEYAQQESKGGRKQERRQSRGAGDKGTDGFYYRDQRDGQRAAEEAMEKRRKEEQAKRDAALRETRQQKCEWQAEQKQRANEEWNQQFERKYGPPTTRTGWRPEGIVSREKTGLEKFIGFVDSFFGL